MRVAILFIGESPYRWKEAEQEQLVFVSEVGADSFCRIRFGLVGGLLFTPVNSHLLIQLSLQRRNAGSSDSLFSRAGRVVVPALLTRHDFQYRWIAVLFTLFTGVLSSGGVWTTRRVNDEKITLHDSP